MGAKLFMDDAERRLAMLVLENDKCPVEEWLDGAHDKLTRARTIRQINGCGLFTCSGRATTAVKIGTDRRSGYA